MTTRIIKYTQFEKYTEINSTERDSISLKHHVYSNDKHKTKENAPAIIDGHTATQLKSVQLKSE